MQHGCLFIVSSYGLFLRHGRQRARPVERELFRYRRTSRESSWVRIVNLECYALLARNVLSTPKLIKLESIAMLVKVQTQFSNKSAWRIYLLLHKKKKQYTRLMNLNISIITCALWNYYVLNLQLKIDNSLKCQSFSLTNFRLLYFTCLTGFLIISVKSQYSRNIFNA